MKRVTKMDDSDSCTTTRMHLILLNWTLKMVELLNTMLHVFQYTQKEKKGLVIFWQVITICRKRRKRVSS